MSADREKFEAWMHREQIRVNREASDAQDAQMWKDVKPTPDHGVLPACLGGPIDGMLAALAESAFKLVGPSLLVHSLLVLTSPTEAPIALQHRYARDHRGAYVYVGFVRVDQC